MQLTTKRLALVGGVGLLAGGLLSTQLLSGVQDGQVPDDLMVLPEVGSIGGPSRELSEAEAEQWLRGLQLFDHDFHRSEGLGTPDMNADSCRACHQDPGIGGAGGLELNVTRFGNDNAGQGPFTNLTGGQGLSKLRPPYVAGREEYDPLMADVFEQRQTPSIFGAGLIDGIPDLEIQLNEDPNDLDGDGIFGVARLIDVGGGAQEVGRFGWKAQIPHLRDFINDAMAGECGITCPDDGRGFALLSDGDPVADPELSSDQIDDLEFFLTHLAAPQRTNPTDPSVLRGELVFEDVGCAKCHTPTLMGANGPVPLYSDLLLHSVMEPTFRGMEEPGAPAGVFQTKPLWGIKDTAPYMHDGRAETLGDAIRAHDGEARNVRSAFMQLSGEDKRALLSFLEDL